jgi:hypothetical protein
VSAHLAKDDVIGLVMLDASDPDRRAAEAHVAECGECRREWSRADQVRALMDGLAPPPAPSAAALQRTRARIHAELDGAKTKKATDPEPEVAATSAPGWATGLAVAVVGAFGFVFIEHEASALRYFVAAAAIGVAAMIGSLAARSDRDARIATLSALALSIGLGAVDLRAFAMELGHAESCFSTHVVACLLPLVAATWLTSSRRGSTSPFHAAAAAACGAVAGQAVLLTACASEESFLHVVFFHVAGVVTAAALGAGSGRLVAALRS